MRQVNMDSGFSFGKDFENGGNWSQFSGAAEQSVDGSPSTTLIPIITSTKPADPHAYEHNVYKDRVKDVDIVKMKDHLRLIYGLPSLVGQKTCKPIDRTRSPNVPRSTITSQRRHEIMMHKLIVRCTGFIGMIENYNKLLEHYDPKYFTQVRDKAMTKTKEQLENEFELLEFRNLKLLAETAKATGEIRNNMVSEMRFRSSRGEPIITNMFREYYNDYRKPPFISVGKFAKMKPQYLPKIDREKEIWLIPLDDEDSGLTPVNIVQPTTRNLKEERSKRELARPPLRKKKNTQEKRQRESESTQQIRRQTGGASGGDKKRKKQKRRPWVYARVNTC